jgi:hypothetical protein
VIGRVNHSGVRKEASSASSRHDRGTTLPATNLCPKLQITCDIPRYSLACLLQCLSTSALLRSNPMILLREKTPCSLPPATTGN